MNRKNRMKSELIRARIDPELRTESQQILDELGITMSQAIRLFLRQVVAHRGLPFSVIKISGRTTTQVAIEESRRIQNNARFTSAQDLFNELEKPNDD